MLQQVEVDVTGGNVPLREARCRYAVLHGLQRGAGRRGIRVYAFGFSGRTLRLLVSGSTAAIGLLAQGLKVGACNMARSKDLGWVSESTYVRAWRGSVLEGAAWCHRAVACGSGEDALASPWCSQRDALGFRLAPFFDPEPLRQAVKPEVLHRACGRGTLPQAPLVPPMGCHRDLGRLMRVSGAVMGVLAPHPRCIPTFVHLATACGAGRSAVADALVVGDRRVRQLLSADAPGLLPAMVTLTDPRLRIVP